MSAPRKEHAARARPPFDRPAGLALALAAAVIATPLGVLLWLALAAATVTALPRRRGRHRRRAAEPASTPPSSSATRSPDAPSTPSASIMVLSWNGLPLLQRLLPSLREALAHDGGDHEVILVDNGSDDGTEAWTRTHFPEVRLVRHARNEKFVRGYDLALPAATRDCVVLLNNDMVVDRAFLRPLLEPFASAPDVFAVSAQISFRDPDKRREETGLTSAVPMAGWFKLRHDEVPADAPELLPTLWAGGGSSAFDRRRLLELGGFDPLFEPFYYEDTSLSWDAHKRGWPVLFAPRSHVVHEHRGTSSKLPQPWLRRVQRRNHWLFHWRNLTSLRHTTPLCLLLPFHLVRLARQRRHEGYVRAVVQECHALVMALARLPRALRQRHRLAVVQVRSDREVLRLVGRRG